MVCRSGHPAGAGGEWPRAPADADSAAHCRQPDRDHGDTPQLTSCEYPGRDRRAGDLGAGADATGPGARIVTDEESSIGYPVRVGRVDETTASLEIMAITSKSLEDRTAAWSERTGLMSQFGQVSCHRGRAPSGLWSLAAALARRGCDSDHAPQMWCRARSCDRIPAHGEATILPRVDLVKLETTLASSCSGAIRSIRTRAARYKRCRRPIGSCSPRHEPLRDLGEVVWGQSEV